MQDFVFFLGRFHVLALHLPIGIILVAVALDWAARSERYRALAAVSPFLWGAAALSAVLTVVLGYMHFAEGTFSGPSASAHRLFGTTVAVASIAIWWLARRPASYRRVNVWTGVVALALVAITGHFGGNLTHGSDFLVQYAPGPLRTLGGLGPEGVAATTRPAAGDDSSVVDRLYRTGFLVRRVSATDPRLVVSVYSPGARVVEEHMAVLLTAADQIVELNLQNADLDDDELAELGRFTELTRLRLSHNHVTDRTVPAFASMPHLERLNLYDNPGITDASVERLAALPSLKRLDVWATGITQDGFARLRELRPDLELQGETMSIIDGIETPIAEPPGAGP